MQADKRTSQRGESLLAVLVIAFVTILAYAPFIGKLGFYQEDLYNIWTGHLQGPRSFIPLFAVDRPLIGYQFAVLYPLFGDRPLPWHLFALGLRLLMVFALFWVLRLTWPEKRTETTAIALLFAVYPGFLQQPQAQTFLTAIAAMALAILSIGLNLASLRVRSAWKIVLMNAIALLFSAVYLQLMEYAIGLEVLRFALLFYVVLAREGRDWKASLLRSLKFAWPYILSTGAFLFWRLFFYNSTRPATDVDRLVGQYSGNPLHMLLRIGIETSKDFLETVFLAWGVPLYKLLYYGAYRDLFYALILAALSIGAMVVYFLIVRRQEGRVEEQESDAKDYLAWLGIGVLAVLLGLLPSIIANRNVYFEDRFDRYTLPASIGVALLIVGFLFTFVRPRIRTWLLSFLIGIAILTHFNNAKYMSDFWDMQKQVWWQLSWRAPSLQPGTLLVVNLPSGFALAEGYEAWAPADMIYYREPGPPQVTAEVLNSKTVFDIYRGGQRPKSQRSIPVNRDFDRALVLSLPETTSCLHVIDGKKYEISDNEDPKVQLIAPYSRIDMIETDAPFQTPPADIFGTEPPHTWCYYYQKASYARQKGDWQEVARLGDQARAQGFSPQVRSEWMPFMEAYANLGREKDAKNLAAIIKIDYGPRNLLCSQLQVPPAYPGPYELDKIVDYLCGAY